MKMNSNHPAMFPAGGETNEHVQMAPGLFQTFEILGQRSSLSS